MARFVYQARSGAGDMATGVVSAGSLEEAASQLRAEGKYIVKISPAAENPDSTEGSSRRVKRREVIFFTHQLAVMVETGVPLSEALRCTGEQSEDPAFKAVISDITAKVEAGSEFSAALRKYPKVFPPVMTSLIKASEVSGTMSIMLERLAMYLTKEEQTLKQARGAMIYPFFMMVMAASVTIFLLTFVLPKFAGIYAARGAALPGPTRLLLAMSNSLVTWWYLWLALAIGGAAGLYIFVRTPGGRRCFDWMKLNLPVVRTLFSKLYLSRACRTMGTMLAAGVSMLDMVAIVRQVTGNTYFEDLWDEVDERLRQGAQLSDPLFASPLVPRSIAQMIFSGERSGQLGKVLTRVAEFTEQEFDQAVKNTTQMIEPLMVAVMGSVVGFIAISLLLPIFSVGRVVAGK